MFPARVQQNSRCSTLTALFNKSNEEASVGFSNTNEVIITSDMMSPSSQKRSDERETTETASVGSSNAKQVAMISEEDPCSQKESEDGETIDGSQDTTQAISFDGCSTENATNLHATGDEAESKDFLVQSRPPVGRLDEKINIFKKQKELYQYRKVNDSLDISVFEGLSLEDYLTVLHHLCCYGHCKPCKKCHPLLKVGNEILKEGYMRLNKADALCSPGKP